MAASNFNLRQDLYRALLYGTPNWIAWLVVHSGILLAEYRGVISRKFLEKHCIASPRNISEGRFLSVIIPHFLHGGPFHLLANFVAFTPECYRLVDCIDNNHKSRSIKIFWFSYTMTGVLSSFLVYGYRNLYKSFLKYKFRNDERMLNDIKIKFDAINKGAEKLGGLGASACVMGLHGFDLCISIQLIIQRLMRIHELLQKEDCHH